MTSHTRGRSALRVGFLTVFGAAAFGILFVYSTGRVLGAEHADLYVRFQAADGLQRGDAVLHRGVRVGEVKSIDFGMDDVIVRVRLVRAVPFGRDAHAAMVAADIFGRQTVVLHDDGGEGPALADGDTVHGTPPTSLTTRFDDIGERVGDLLSERTIEDLRDVLNSAGDAARGAGRTADGIAGLVNSARRVLEEQHGAFTEVSAEAGALLGNLRASTDPDSLNALRARVVESADNLAGATANIDTAAASMARLLASLESGDGSLALLLRDPALHERAVGVLTSLERLLDDIRENPKRYVTIRVF